MPPRAPSAGEASSLRSNARINPYLVITTTTNQMNLASSADFSDDVRRFLSSLTERLLITSFET
jgi:hypothetical protein